MSNYSDEKLESIKQNQASNDFNINYLQIKQEALHKTTEYSVDKSNMEIKREFAKELTETECLVDVDRGFLMTQIKQEREELYMGYVIKEELEIGPEVLQQPVLDTDPIKSDIGRYRCAKTTSGGSQQRNTAPEEVFCCNMCDKKFTLSRYLICHLKTHSNDKPYSCSDCSKKFTQKRSLNRHMRTHTGKSYFCHICNKRLAHSTGFAVHMRIHTGDKPYNCNVYSKKIAASCGLKNHIRTYVVDRPYCCNICYKKFASNSNLSVHMRTHTSDNAKTWQG